MKVSIVKFKIFILTYNNNFVLNEWALKSLFESNANFDLIKNVYIINNHSNIEIYDEYKDKVIVLNNDVRPDFSTGHISRSWNQAIINGFKDLNNPDCDFVIAIQNDVKFVPDWQQNLVEYINQGFRYIIDGVGDSFQLFSPESVKTIGLYDERFHTGNHESDYELRALIDFYKKSSINDYKHGRVYNPIRKNSLIQETPSGLIRGEPYAIASIKYHPISIKFWNLKWDELPRFNWNEDLSVVDLLSIRPLCKNYIYYPYFEKDIYNLDEKYYNWDEPYYSESS